MNYVKLFSSILDSTIWEAPLETKVLWITMLAMADRDGVISASVPGLAKRAGVDRKACEEALAYLMAPDPDSSRPEHDGRRIEKADMGWRILNFVRFQRYERPSLATSAPAITYFIQSTCEDGLIKIGRSNDVRSRLATLATGSAAPLRLLGTIPEDVESSLHRKFSHLRRHGEWFEPRRELLEFIECSVRRPEVLQ